MPRLSVNVNKVATLRNSRGGALPSVTDAVRVCVNAGARGITVHPRADARHITPFDVTAIASFLAPMRRDVEFNIEGDPRPDLLEMVREVRPHQCTLVPVRPGEVTSQAGWPAESVLSTDSTRPPVARCAAAAASSRLRSAHATVLTSKSAAQTGLRSAFISACGNAATGPPDRRTPAPAGSGPGCHA